MTDNMARLLDTDSMARLLDATRKIKPALGVVMFPFSFAKRKTYQGLRFEQDCAAPATTGATVPNQGAQGATELTMNSVSETNAQIAK